MLFERCTANCYHIKMKSKKEIRVDNLKILIDEAGGRKEFTNRHEATELGIAYNYVGQLINKSRGIGDNTAEKLEVIGGKSKYWLDHPQHTVNEPKVAYAVITQEQLEWNDAYAKLNQPERDNILATIRLLLR